MNYIAAALLFCLNPDNDKSLLECIFNFNLRKFLNSWFTLWIKCFLSLCSYYVRKKMERFNEKWYSKITWYVKHFLKKSLIWITINLWTFWKLKCIYN